MILWIILCYSEPDNNNILIPIWNSFPKFSLPSCHIYKVIYSQSDFITILAPHYIPCVYLRKPTCFLCLFSGMVKLLCKALWTYSPINWIQFLLSLLYLSSSHYRKILYRVLKEHLGHYSYYYSHILYIFEFIYFVCVCINMCISDYMCTTRHVWRSEYNFQELVLSNMWVSGMKFRLSGLTTSAFTNLNHLLDVIVNFHRIGQKLQRCSLCMAKLVMELYWSWIQIARVDINE